MSKQSDLKLNAFLRSIVEVVDLKNKAQSQHSSTDHCVDKHGLFVVV
jgi:hypothetical protein